MSRQTTVLPLSDLAEADAAELKADLWPAAAIAAMSVPQGLAYALIAGLPPGMGLYAATVPTLVGALFRSSRHTLVGPTNAMSVIVATSAVATAADPVAAAGTLALLVGVFQLLAGALRLGGLVDYISASVVTGYVTGAATLIAVGQLPNVTGTPGATGDIVTRFLAWGSTLRHADPLSVLLAVSAVGGIAWLRRSLTRGVPMLLVVLTGIALTALLGLDAMGVRVLGDTSPIGLPPFALPSAAGLLDLFPVAVAATVLSLVESTSIARATAERTGQRLDTRMDFFGLGLANVTASLFGGYPVSGSLARSALAVQLGAKTRLVGVWAALFLLLALPFLGLVLARTPVPVVAGVVLVAAWDILDLPKIRAFLEAGAADRFAFLGTVLGTWILPLDQAIYVGVGISVALFLRRARLLVIRELWVGADGRLHEVDLDHPPILPADHPGRCKAIAILHVEGPLFFGSARELLDTLMDYVDDEDVRVVIVRLKRAQGVDYTAAQALRHVHELLRKGDRHLFLVGMREETLVDLEDAGLTRELGPAALFPTRPGWFAAMDGAVEKARELVGPPETDRHRCTGACPLTRTVHAPAPVPEAT